jgi:hypothetical protein
MDIEDRYGDLQDLYWHSKDGDLILNKLNSNIGIVEHDNHRIYVKDGNNIRKFQVTIYRPEHPMIKPEDFKMIDLESKCKLITGIAVKY